MIFIYVLLLTVVGAIELDEISKQNKTMVLFKIDSCPICQELQPTWDKLLETYDLYTVDCEEEEIYCLKAQVYEYPTIFYTTPRGWRIYEGETDLESMVDFLDKYIVIGCLENESLCDEQELEFMKKLSMSTDKELKQMTDIHNDNLHIIQDYSNELEEKLRKELRAAFSNKTYFMLNEMKNYSYVNKEIYKRKV